MRNKFSTFLNNLGQIASRYPVVLFFSYATALFLFTIIHLEHYSNDEDFFFYSKLAYFSALGISLSFAFAMYAQRKSLGTWLQLLAFPIVVMLYFTVPLHKDDFIYKHGIFLFIYFLLSHLLVAFLPYINNIREQKFWEYNKNLFINVILTGIFTGVLIAGILLAISALEGLFNIHIDDEVYPKTIVTVGTLGSTLIFLLFGREGLFELESDQEYPIVLQFFVQFILIPLLCIYATILFAYGLKILIEWELPNGWVSKLIISYAVMGILALLLVHPLLDGNSKSWVKWFSKLFYITMIPFTVLLFVAIFRRLNDYGFTEPRYYVLLLAIWFSTLTVYFLVAKADKIKFIPISLFLFGLASITIPYFNSYQVALRSQKKLFTKRLTDNNLLTADGRVDFAQPVSQDLLSELGSQVNFFSQRNQTDYLQQFFTLNEDHNQTYSRNMYDYEFIEKFTNVERSISQNFVSIVQADNHDQTYEIAGYDYFVQYANANTQMLKVNEEYSIKFLDNSILLYQNNIEVARHDLNPDFKELEEKTTTELRDHTAVDFKLGEFDGRIVMYYLQRIYNLQNSEDFYSFNGVLLLKK